MLKTIKQAHFCACDKMGVPDPDIRWGVKFASGNIGFGNRIPTLPHCVAFLLRRALSNLHFNPISGK